MLLLLILLLRGVACCLDNCLKVAVQFITDDLWVLLRGQAIVVVLLVFQLLTAQVSSGSSSPLAARRAFVGLVILASLGP